MDEIEFIGMAIVFLIPMLTSLFALIKPFISSVVKLNTTITRLNDRLDQLDDVDKTQTKRLDVHEGRLDNLEHTVTEHSVTIAQLQYDHRALTCVKREEK